MPETIGGIGNDLASFGEFLTEHHPDLASLASLERRHVEGLGFFTWLPRRSRRGHLTGDDRPISVVAVSRAITTLRTFLEDIIAWGWADAPGPAADLRHRHPPPAQAAPAGAPTRHRPGGHGSGGQLDDPFARAGLSIIRGTGLRVGELVDLGVGLRRELRRQWDLVARPPRQARHQTKRSVPLDDHTLAAFDDWMGHRGRHRSLPHPRHGRPVDFLFVKHGQRLYCDGPLAASVVPIAAWTLVDNDVT